MNCKECLKEYVLKKLIERRAYELYEWRMEFDEGGNAYTDWMTAEEEILNNLAEQAVDNASKDIQQKNDNL